MRKFARWFSLIQVAVVIMLALSTQLAFAQTGPDPACGAKCLYMSMRQLGISPPTYRHLLEKLGKPSKEGYSLAELQSAAVSFGLNAKCVEMNIESLTLLECEAILHVEPGHFVLLSKSASAELTVFEASTGYARPGPADPDVLSNWTGKALLLSSTDITIPTVRVSWGKWLWGTFLVSFVCLCLYGWRRFALARGSGLVLLLSVFIGCEREGNSVAINSSADKSKVNARPSNVSAELSRVDMGELPFSLQRHLVEVSLRNESDFPVSFIESSVSCRCLLARFRTSVIPARGEATLELLLDLDRPGPQSATCTIEMEPPGTLVLPVTWTVVRSGLKVSPTSLADLVLQAGQSQVVTLAVERGDTHKDLPLNATFAARPSSNSEDVSCVCSIDSEGNLRAEFSIKAHALPGTVLGNLLLMSNEELQARVPIFIVIEDTRPFAIDRETLYLYANDRFGSTVVSGQLVIENVAKGDKIALNWKDLPADELRFSRIEGEGRVIIDVDVDAGLRDKVTSVVVRVNETEQVIPVVFPLQME
jgi:hypothetical protein